MMRSLFLLAIVFAGIGNGFAQNPNSKMGKAKEADFAYEVKTIDEFIERFNNENNTLVKTYLEKNFPTRKMPTRPELVKSLFNYTDPVWDKDLADQFVKDVCDSTKKEKFLDFYSDDWYALAECQVKYKGTSRRAYIVYQVSTSEREGVAKWVICGARAPFLDFSKKVDRRKFLNPISHSTNFIGMKNAIDDRQFLRNYLSDNFKESHLNKFLAEVASGDIQFEQINYLTYHFLSVDGWMFTVKDYLRLGQNAGWLIQSLAKKTKEEKIGYRREVLYCD